MVNERHDDMRDIFMFILWFSRELDNNLFYFFFCVLKTYNFDAKYGSYDIREVLFDIRT